LIPELYKSRLKKLRQELKDRKVDGLFVSKQIHIRYLTGFRGDDSWGLVTPSRMIVFSDFRYEEEVKKGFPWVQLVLRGKKESLFDCIAKVCQKNGVRRLAFEAADTQFAFYQGLRRGLKRIKLIPTQGLVESLRIIKAPSEIRDLKKACQITDTVLGRLLKRAKPGMPEIDIKYYAEDQMKRLGAEGPSFDLIIACGAKTSQPHAVSDKNRVKNGTVFLFDMGSKVNGYHSDLTRTFFTGSISPKFRKVYEAVLEAQQAAIACVKPGVRVGEVDLAARQALEKRGLAKYFGHSTGHGVGLEIHEAPGVFHTNRSIVQENMLFTVEPGVYLPGWGGIRIEDIVRVTKTGCEVITKFPNDRLRAEL